MKKFIAALFIILIFVSLYVALKKDNVIDTEGVLVKNFKGSMKYGYI